MSRGLAITIFACTLAFCVSALAQDATTDSVEAEASAEQEAAEPATHPLIARSERLQQRLAEVRSRFDGLEAEAKKAVGEELQILEHQIAESKMDFLRVLGDTVNNLLSQEKAELDTSEARELIEGLLISLGPALRKHIDASEQLLAQRRSESEEADVLERLSHEQAIGLEVNWLQYLYRAYATYIEQLELLELEDSVSREDYVERLATRADRLSGRIQVVTEQLGQLQVRLAENPDDATLQAEVQLLEERKKIAIAAMSDGVGLLDSAKLDSSAYRRQLIQSTGEVTTDVFRSGVFMGLLRDWLEQGQSWLGANGPLVFFRLLLFFFILLAFRALGGVARRVLRRSADSQSSADTSQLLQNMLQGITHRGIMLIGLLVALSTLGIQLGPLLTGLGIAGFIVGFALQDSLSNFAAGVMILGYQPYDVDDLIDAGGVFGRVSHMSLVSTTILTIDNQTLIVPNSKIWGDVIKNITSQKERRVDMKFRISYSDDVERLERIFGEILEQHPKVLADPEPMVKLHELGEFAMEFVVRPWVKTGDYWDVYWDVTREVKCRLDAEGIQVPVPQTDVRLLGAD
ncbi:MAG: mechanosensitive ion channel family protein [Deltaproteobacteria bacterium]|nr:mechanosensitive ion channel family protein [Deltaproteobacteria bacterium]